MLFLHYTQHKETIHDKLIQLSHHINDLLLMVVKLCTNATKIRFSQKFLILLVSQINEKCFPYFLIFKNSVISKVSHLQYKP